MAGHRPRHQPPIRCILTEAMPALPDPPADSEDVDAHETTLQFESDPNTLVQEIEKAKEQEACLIVIRGKPQGHRFFPDAR
jgi:predicted ATP-grasp superfamily ATP-dependent carboligase